MYIPRGVRSKRICVLTECPFGHISRIFFRKLREVSSKRTSFWTHIHPFSVIGSVLPLNTFGITYTLVFLFLASSIIGYFSWRTNSLTNMTARPARTVHSALETIKLWNLYLACFEIFFGLSTLISLTKSVAFQLTCMSVIENFGVALRKLRSSYTHKIMPQRTKNNH